MGKAIHIIIDCWMFIQTKVQLMWQMWCPIINNWVSSYFLCEVCRKFWHELDVKMSVCKLLFRISVEFLALIIVHEVVRSCPARYSVYVSIQWLSFFLNYRVCYICLWIEKNHYWSNYLELIWPINPKGSSDNQYIKPYHGQLGRVWVWCS